jgi:hypothetical protein
MDFIIIKGTVFCVKSKLRQEQLQKSQISAAEKLKFWCLLRFRLISESRQRKSVSNPFIAKVVLDHKTISAMKSLINTTLLLLPVFLSAQDVLFKTDNTKLEVKVDEISNNTIRYKLYNHLDGPYYILDKKDAAMVIYQNGTHEVFKTKPVAGIPYDNNTLEDYNRIRKFTEVARTENVVFVNAIELLNSGIGISYLREVYSNRFLIHVPFAASFAKPGLDNALNAFGQGGIGKIQKTHYDIGLGLYFNTCDKRSVTHFIGPLIRNAQYSGSFYYSYYDGTDYGSSEGSFSMNETSLMLNNGFLYRITPNFNIMLNAAFGKFIGRNYSRGEMHKDAQLYGAPSRELALHAGVHLGYRF